MVDDLLAVRELVLGRDPFQLAELEHILFAGPSAAAGLVSQGGPGGCSHSALWEGRLKSPPRTFGAIEVACLDLIGKALDRPVYDLLGGRVRDRVPYSAYLFYKHRGAGGALGFDTDPLRHRAGTPPGSAKRWMLVRWSSRPRRWSQAFGFGSIKLKAGVLPPEEEVRTIKLLRDAFGPDVPCASIPMPRGRSKPAAAMLPSWKACWNIMKTRCRKGRHGRAGKIV